MTTKPVIRPITDKTVHKLSFLLWIDCLLMICLHWTDSCP